MSNQQHTMSNQQFDFRRRHPRRGYTAEILFALKNEIYSGTIKNISLGGAFIETKSVNQVSMGDLISINIPYTCGKKNLKQKARVEWMNNEGFAVAFY